MNRYSKIWKRTAAGFLTAILLCSLAVVTPVLPASAAEKGDALTARQQEAVDGQLKRRSDTDYIPAKDWPEAPEIEAEAAVLIDADSKTVLYAKNADSKQYPASITKILTALITLEDSSLTDTLVFEKEALLPLPSGYVSIEPTAGETMSVEDCLYGLLLASANDAANALAVHDAGTIAAFARKMNQRAAQAGATHTHFTNPSGLAEDTHYTTPYDMAMIMSECIRNADFLKIAGTQAYTIGATNKHAARKVEMRHQMLSESSPYYYPYFVAGKTGHTTPAGYTLVTYAKKGNRNLIACVMKCTEDGAQYRSTRALLDYGFDSFRILEGDQADQIATPISSDSLAFQEIQNSPDFAVIKTGGSPVILPEGVYLQDLDTTVEWLNPEKEADQALAKLTYSYEGVSLGTTRLKLSLTRNLQLDKEIMAGRRLYPIICGACLFGILLLLVIVTVCLICYVRNHKKNHTLFITFPPEEEEEKEKEKTTAQISENPIAQEAQQVENVTEAEVKADGVSEAQQTESVTEAKVKTDGVSEKTCLKGEETSTEIRAEENVISPEEKSGEQTTDRKEEETREDD